MIAATYLLVLAFILPNGDTELSVIDSGMSRDDCELALFAAPLPYKVQGIVFAFSCELDQGD